MRSKATKQQNIMPSQTKSKSTTKRRTGSSTKRRGKGKKKSACQRGLKTYHVKAHRRSCPGKK